MLQSILCLQLNALLGSKDKEDCGDGIKCQEGFHCQEVLDDIDQVVRLCVPTGKGKQVKRTLTQTHTYVDCENT